MRICGCWSVAGSQRVKPFVNVQREEPPKQDQLSLDAKNLNLRDQDGKNGDNPKSAQTFTFEELATATGNFRSDCFLGEGGFGKVYKGFIERINQVCAY